MKHTQGDWAVKPQLEKKHGSMFYVISDGGKCSVCGRANDYRHICVTLESAVGMEQAEANAKLISAAPDMLDALQFVKGVLANAPKGHYDGITMRTIDSAIKKATE